MILLFLSSGYGLNRIELASVAANSLLYLHLTASFLLTDAVGTLSSYLRRTRGKELAYYCPHFLLQLRSQFIVLDYHFIYAFTPL
jgi:hypothetical protein